jgi:predicted nuclease with TOPRIM domain
VEAALREEMADAFARARHETSRGDLARHEAHRLEAANAQLESANTALKIEIAAIGDRINEVSRENAALARESAVRAETIDDLVCQRDELRGAVERFARSKSWRYLAPARAVGQLLRRCFGIRS